MIPGTFSRCFNAFLAAVILVLLAPLMLLITVLIRKKLGRPAIFRQIRSGLNGKPFEILKFRTMENIYDSQGKLLPDEQRMNSFGKFLRSTSIDELPELINVIKGDMSLVGPRPLLMEYLPLYSTAQQRRHALRPGITGWAQINGRNAISWQKKFELDVWYIENWSFWLDLKILFITVWKVLKRSDINQTGQATIAPFNGKN